MTKTIMILAIVAAFVVGSIATGSIAYAVPNSGWQAAIDEQQQQIDDLKTNEILGFYQVAADSVVISPQSSLTGAAECDDEDIAISGGWNRINGDMRVIFSVQTSINIWGFNFENIDDTNNAEVTPFALCADYAPEHIDED